MYNPQGKATGIRAPKNTYRMNPQKTGISPQGIEKHGKGVNPQDPSYEAKSTVIKGVSPMDDEMRGRKISAPKAKGALARFAAKAIRK